MSAPKIWIQSRGGWQHRAVVRFTRQFGHRFAVFENDFAKYVACCVQSGARIYLTESDTPSECVRKLNRFLNQIQQVPWWSKFNDAGIPPHSRRGLYLPFLSALRLSEGIKERGPKPGRCK